MNTQKPTSDRNGKNSPPSKGAQGDDQSQHCGVCGTKHPPEEGCPISAFAYMECDCGNGFLMPWDATMMGPVNCGQCGSDENWSTRQATKEDVNDNQ